MSSSSGKGLPGYKLAKRFGLSYSGAYEIARTAALGYSRRQRRLERKRRAKK